MILITAAAVALLIRQRAAAIREEQRLRDAAYGRGYADGYLDALSAYVSGPVDRSAT